MFGRCPAPFSSQIPGSAPTSLVPALPFPFMALSPPAKHYAAGMLKSDTPAPTKATSTVCASRTYDIIMDTCRFGALRAQRHLGLLASSEHARTDSADSTSPLLGVTGDPDGGQLKQETDCASAEKRIPESARTRMVVGLGSVATSALLVSFRTSSTCPTTVG